MSNPISFSSDKLCYQLTPPVFEKGAQKGKSQIFFFHGGLLVHGDTIDVTRPEMETRSICTVTGKVRKLDLKTSFEFVTKEVIEEIESYDLDQIEKAHDLALAKLAESGR